jgi:uncharacterized membrane protein
MVLERGMPPLYAAAMRERHPLSPDRNDPDWRDPDAPLFAARITPHRSLGEKGFRLVMTLVCLATVVSSIPFMIAGAWPVAGFFGLDLIALYIAFRVNFRDGRGFEQVAVSPLKVDLAKVTPRGERREWRFDTLWTKLEREKDEDYGLMRLAVVSRGQSVMIGQALSPAERESFADEFGQALSRAKAP